MPEVLDPEVDPLLNVAVPDDLVHDHTDGVGSDVVHDAGPPMTHVSVSTDNETRHGNGRTRGSTCGACPSAVRR